jgi:hypothetical protein
MRTQSVEEDAADDEALEPRPLTPGKWCTSDAHAESNDAAEVDFHGMTG